MAATTRLDAWTAWATILLFLLFPLSAAAGNVAMGIVLALWLASGRLARNWTAIAAHPVVWATVGLVAVIVAGTLHTGAPWSDVALHLRKYAKLLLIPVLIDVLAAPSVRRRALDAFVASVSIVLAITYVRFLLGPPDAGAARISEQALFGDYLVQSILFSAFALVCATRAITARAPLSRAAWIVAIALAAFAITHLSIGRTGAVMLGVVALTVLAFVSRRAIVPGAVVLAGVLAVLLVTSGAMQQRWSLLVDEVAQHESNKLSSIGHRLYDIRTTTALIAQRPLLGWGTGAYHTEVCKVVERPEWCEVFNWHPHNQFLFFGVGHGVVGVAAYLLLFVALLRSAARVAPRDQRMLLFGATAMLFVDSLFNSPLWSARESVLFIMLIALAGAPALLPDSRGDRR